MTKTTAERIRLRVQELLAAAPPLTAEQVRAAVLLLGTVRR